MDLDEFSDDSLDDLPDNALQELENNAIQFTQGHGQTYVPPRAANQQAQPEYIWVEDDDLDTTEVINDVGVPVGRPVVDNTLQQQKQQQQQQQQQQEARRSVPPVPNPQWNPTVDPSKRATPGLTTRPRPPSAGPPNHPVFGSQRFQSQTSGLNRAQPSQFARPALPTNRFAPSQASQAPAGDIVSALQARLRALESELAAARGEVSIIRSNSTKAQQQHDAEVNRLKKLNAEQLAKQERILEAAVAAENNANTELQFLQQDIREVNDRTRRKDVAGGTRTTTTTPKKATKTWRVADGFDEMDIVLSPNKGQGRGKNAGPVAVNVGERTPSKGKRKRPTVDSPVMALETHTGDAVVDEERPEPIPVQTETGHVAPAPPPFDFLPLVLDHGCFPGQPPTFETFARFAFPSEPGISFSAIIFQTLPLMGSSEYPMQLLVDFAELMVSLWTRCCEEKYWEPIKYLVALISFTFQLHATEVAPFLIGTLIDICQSTIYLLAEWRHRLLDADLPEHNEYQLLNEHIDTTSILSLLYTTAMTCSTALEETETSIETRAAQFWKFASLDLASILLTPKQRLSDVLGMLELLATSSLPQSIGPITDEKDAAFVAQLIIDKVTSKLTDFPRAATTPAQKRTVRVSALRTLIAFARYPFGAIQLASSSTALPRLVTCLSTSLDDLYDQPIPSFILSTASKDDESRSSSEPESPSTILCRIISQCVILIHTLVTGPHTANIADVSQKLSTFHGGSQRYLIALGRLTFAEEDLVLEAGIDGETVEAAHELLEMAVTPDEGEIVSEAFGA